MTAGEVTDLLPCRTASILPPVCLLIQQIVQQFHKLPVLCPQKEIHFGYTPLELLTAWRNGAYVTPADSIGQSGIDKKL